MDIKKFGQFILETSTDKSLVKNIILDKLIDDDGNVINKKGYIIDRPDIDFKGYIKGSKKGFATRDLKKIVSNEWDNLKRDDKYEYPAGIDKNGEVFSFNVNDKNYVLNKDGDVIYNKIDSLPWEISTRDNPKIYNDQISILPTGWVNVKIDMEVIKKIKRFSTNLGDNTPGGFMKKLEYLSNPKKLKQDKYNSNSDLTENIQKRMAVVMLLRYMEEIKDYFNPSQSGFLFESFLGGLLPGRVPDNNAYYDMLSEDGSTTYQVKFYDYKADSIDINSPMKEIKVGKDVKIVQNLDNWCNYYIIALKEHNKIHLWNLKKDNGIGTTSKENLLDTYLSDTLTQIGKKVDGLKYKRMLRVSDLKSHKTGDMYVCIDLSKIDDVIDECSEGLKEIVKDLWETVSSLQYNVETILVGVDQNHKKLEEGDINKLYDNAKGDVKNLENMILNLQTKIK